MKTILFTISIIFLFTACSEKNVTREECVQENKVFKAERKLNFRTGEYETVTYCVEQR